MTYHVVSESRGSGPYNKRRGASAIPHNALNLMTQAQQVSLRQMEAFGWSLAFVRRMNGIQPQVFVINRGRYARLEQDGSLNVDASLSVRD